MPPAAAAQHAAPLPPPQPVAPDDAAGLLLRAVQSPTARHLAAGALAGAVAKTLTAPLDRLKILFQVGADRFTLLAAARALRGVAADEGLAGLWRGHGATLLRILPYAGVHYAAHERLEEALRGARGLAPAPPGTAPPALGVVDRFLAGAGAGGVATALTYPLDVLRAQLAVDRSRTLRGGAAALLAAGPGAAYRGIGPTLGGIMPYSGVSWVTYQTLRDRFGAARTAAAQADARAAGADPDAVAPVGATQVDKLVAGALAGLLGQSATYPLDVARRRMQVGGARGAGSALAVLAHVVRTEGAGALFKGLSLNFVKSPVATSASFACFEIADRALQQQGERARARAAAA